jgi:type II secretory pathway component PulL
MTTKFFTAFKVVLAMLAFVSIMLLAGWLDAPEIEAHEQWYAEQSQRTWCL